MPEVNAVLAKMRAFTERVRSGAWKGHTGKRITDVVNIGIGGSRPRPGDGDRGAEAVLAGRAARALRLERRRHAHRRDAASSSIPRRTLFIVASKTFTTQETMTNATSRARLAPREARATTTRRRQALRRAVDEREGGREVRHRHRRTCSSSGTGSAAATRCGARSACRSRASIGMDNFEELLAGGHEMDEHFRTAPLEQNLPVILGHARRLVHELLRRRDARDPARTTSTCIASPRTSSRATWSRNGKSVDRDGHRDHRLHDGPDHLGRARHERAARVLPAHPPGHARSSRATSSRRSRRTTRSGEHHDDPARELLRADRGADEGQDRRRGARRARGAEAAARTRSTQLVAAQDVPRQPADDVDPGPEDHAADARHADRAVRAQDLRAGHRLEHLQLRSVGRRARQAAREEDPAGARGRRRR